MEKFQAGFDWLLDGGVMVDVLSALICAGICWRIVLYRREGARYRLHMSVLAYLIAMGSGGYAMSIALHGPSGITHPFVALILAVLGVMVFRARGNVANVFRVHWGN